ncbi:flagellar basal body L-ring protein FlgH [Qingshengfaniella alkalisoli]|uniref:Flagellar L-ring protein n=1 Tax=Qingshengfaniella alkalisoli TaxID=2599296 RepID=A0A5B8IZ16_9RHOB|nr:flagellar basal body L-ring protein FlgH [Qingshengfaniella alkalisoli]QDY70151.1 flagellar basal body L-ring protein FlgH [Qingshengfaniella alkalisoli]
MRNLLTLGLIAASVAACGRIDHVGRRPDFAPTDIGRDHLAMAVPGLPPSLEKQRVVDQASLWSGTNSSLLSDQRAAERGDILTVVIEIDERAEISNSTSRSRSADESLQIPQLFGLPQRLDTRLPDGATSADAVSVASSSDSGGDGSVRRNEKLTLSIAATVTDVLPNGIMRIQGSQEVRVNFEIRELLVEGYVRPADVSRNNEITYDKIAAARISYGGRGQISDVQQPRYGQQIADIILPF